MKILFLLRSLDVGGTERQVLLLSKGLAEKGHEVSVAVFYKGALDSQLSKGVKFILLDKKSFWDMVGFWRRLLRCIDDESPAIIYSFLTVPNFFSGLLKIARSRVKIVWGLRSANLAGGHYSLADRNIFYLTSALSKFVDLIICNSETAKNYHQKYYRNPRMIVIPNVLDTNRFKRETAQAKILREKWRVQSDEILIGYVGRLNPIKNHDLFLQSLGDFAKAGGRFKAVCIGRGTVAYRNHLLELSRELNIAKFILWLDYFEGMPAAYSAFDVNVLCSHSESFPNVVLEAMACGTPCAVTDTAGDSSQIVDGLGFVVPPERERLALVYKKIQTGGTPWTASEISQAVSQKYSEAQIISRTDEALTGLTD